MMFSGSAIRERKCKGGQYPSIQKTRNGTLRFEERDKPTIAVREPLLGIAKIMGRTN